MNTDTYTRKIAPFTFKDSSGCVISWDMSSSLFALTFTKREINFKKSLCLIVSVRKKTIPIRKQYFENWIDFYAWIRIGKLKMKVDYYFL